MMSHKKIHRFLVEHIPAKNIGDQITIDDSRITKQINRVLKIRPGEDIQIFADEGMQYTITLRMTTDLSLTGIVKDIAPVVAVPRTIIAAISIVKGDAFELMVQKLTEIGVSTIVPLLTNRTVKQSIRLNRLQAISDEAVEQCGGTRRVHITEPMTLKECFEAYPFDSVVLDPICPTSHVERMADTMVLYVGPEGGWDEQDEAIIERFKPQHLQITTRVLRTETAAILGAYKLLW